jgi:hypothetical protein
LQRDFVDGSLVIARLGRFSTGWVEQPGVNPTCDRLWHTVVGHASLAPKSDLDHSWLILDEQTHGFTPQAPLFRKVPNAVVHLKSRICCRMVR